MMRRDSFPRPIRVYAATRHGRFTIATAIGVCFLIAGCNADRPLNPSFPLKIADAKIAWKQMQADPKPLQRPVVVLGGIYDPGIVAAHVADAVRQITLDDSQVISVSFFEISSFDACAEKLLNAVDSAFPGADPEQTVEVDVIGFSMGGLVARHAASAPYHGPRHLRLARLFTIGTPHRGAKLAWIPTFDHRVTDMRADSAFLAALNLETPTYEIYPYAKLGDAVVGAANAAPPGQTAWWVARSWSPSHVMAGFDLRILADIARRLRGEVPFATRPVAPLPGATTMKSQPSGE